MDYMSEYKRWCEKATEDELNIILKEYTAAQIEDAFYQNLSFGTGGLRGIIGAGSNRMNVYTVAKASQGLANYLVNKYKANISISIGYDSRIKSDMFAKVAATVFAANDITVNMWPCLTPVSTVSFATRYLNTSAGVMITASHNPSEYNGYKVYADDGCQITTEAAAEILREIEKLDIFVDVKRVSFNDALNQGRIKYIDDSVMTAFIEQVKSQSVLFGDDADLDVSIVYTPLNGTGYIPVTRVLSEVGFKNITLVEEQRLPDGNFPTCPYPNPEIREAMDLGLEYCTNCGADLLLATDPDSDRVGIAVKGDNGDYVLLSGNETGILLLDFICSQRLKHGKMPSAPIMIKTIVTTELGRQIANNYQVETVDVLTGFKFIGEQIGYFETAGKEDRYIFGFEESYGYLSGSYVRDKDAVGASYLICEMFAYYKTRGISLLSKLNELYNKYGYSLNTLHCFQFEGLAGMSKMNELMRTFRETVGIGHHFAGKKIIHVSDYGKGLFNLPKSDVVKYNLEDNCSIIVRPSGTEPKLKTYISVSAKDKASATILASKIAEELCCIINRF